MQEINLPFINLVLKMLIKVIMCLWSYIRIIEEAVEFYSLQNRQQSPPHLNRTHYLHSSTFAFAKRTSWSLEQSLT